MLRSALDETDLPRFIFCVCDRPGARGKVNTTLWYRYERMCHDLSQDQIHFYTRSKRPGETIQSPRPLKCSAAVAFDSFRSGSQLDYRRLREDEA